MSTPLRWDEVDEQIDPATFSMGGVLERVQEHGDVSEGMLTTRQSLSKALRALKALA